MSKDIMNGVSGMLLAKSHLPPSAELGGEAGGAGESSTGCSGK